MPTTKLSTTELSTTIFPAPPAVSIPILGLQARFPVRRVFCVGRNYAEHAKEMGASPERGERPVFFTKPSDAIVADGLPAAYPSATDALHFEVELVLALHSGGSNIAHADALSHIYGYAVGNDLTRRDLQLACKKAGLPWDIAKAFDASAPISAIAPAAQIGHVCKGAITLAVNGVLRQQADIADLLWSVPEIIHELSKLFALAAGDLIFTGTPAGVGALARGDVVQGDIAGVGTLRHRIV
jgi:fumarylpyruvate hydrolase